MAKARQSRKRKSRRGFVAIPYDTSLTLSMLADQSVLKQTLLGANFGEDIFIISVKGSLSLRNMTVGEGPIHVGYSHSDLSVTEISEALTAELTDPDDIIAKERARRPVRKVGSFEVTTADEVFNLGIEVKTPIKFSVGDGHNLDVWVFNRSGGALTTGGVLVVHGTIFGRWQR